MTPNHGTLKTNWRGGGGGGGRKRRHFVFEESHPKHSIRRTPPLHFHAHGATIGANTVFLKHSMIMEIFLLTILLSAQMIAISLGERLFMKNSSFAVHICNFVYYMYIVFYTFSYKQACLVYPTGTSLRGDRLIYVFSYHTCKCLISITVKSLY